MGQVLHGSATTTERTHPVRDRVGDLSGGLNLRRLLT